MKDLSKVVRKLQITEKGTDLKYAHNQYLFEVDKQANKLEIKAAVEQLFNVTVTKVNTMRYSGKKKRERTVKFGKRADWKRAVVTLKEGDQIEVS
ncbi:50S ribosomal protein L23 [bacterium E08(2017)]|nr:50S ribosomal protein L23 [bacterium E08(2017)]